jgi:serine/threonine protein kinase
MSETLFEGKYRIHGLLGKGGMGEVYAATHVLSRAEVAIKCIPRGRATQERSARLLKESAAMGALIHPNIVRLHDAGVTSDGVVYLIMERVHGDSLRALLAASVKAGEPIDLRAVLYILAQVAEAMEFAHTKGVLHRDLKPENIMVGEGSRATVLDFGLAKHEKGQVGAVTDPARVLGTPRYMAPEQVRGQPVDARTDIYAMGLILYEAIANRRPYGEDSAASTTEVMAHHAFSDPIPLAELAPTCPPNVVSIVETCLNKRPEDRFRTMAELARALRGALRELVSPRISGVPLLAGEEQEQASFVMPSRVAASFGVTPPLAAAAAASTVSSSLAHHAPLPLSPARAQASVSAAPAPRLVATAPLPEEYRAVASLPFREPEAPPKRGVGFTQKMPEGLAAAQPSVAPAWRSSAPGAAAVDEATPLARSEAQRASQPVSPPRSSRRGLAVVIAACVSLAAMMVVGASVLLRGKGGESVSANEPPSSAASSPAASSPAAPSSAAPQASVGGAPAEGSSAAVLPSAEASAHGPPLPSAPAPAHAPVAPPASARPLAAPPRGTASAAPPRAPSASPKALPPENRPLFDFGTKP